MLLFYFLRCHKQPIVRGNMIWMTGYTILIKADYLKINIENETNFKSSHYFTNIYCWTYIIRTIDRAKLLYIVVNIFGVPIAERTVLQIIIVNNMQMTLFYSILNNTLFDFSSSDNSYTISVTYCR